MVICDRSVDVMFSIRFEHQSLTILKFVPILNGLESDDKESQLESHL